MVDFKYNKAGRLYRVAKAFSIEAGIIPPLAINGTFIRLDKKGRLTILEGFCWNGANFSFDTNDIMKGSCVHDAFCYLFNKGLITKENRKDADRLFNKMNKEAGMPWWRRWYIYQAVRKYFEFKY